MELLKYLSILSLGLGVISFGFETEVRLIGDVIESYDKQQAIVAIVCWGVSNKINFTRELLKTGNARTIQFAKKLKAIEKYNGEDTLILLDSNCEDSGEFLEEANKNNKFENPYRWMILSNSTKDIGDNQSTLKNLSILVNSDVLVAYKTSNGIILRKVYKIDSTSDFIIEPFATWTYENGLIVSKEAKKSTPVRRKNLRGKHIGMSTVSLDESTKTGIYNLNDTVTDNISKCTLHNILPLYDYMNATTELLFTGTWGYLINGSWNGMLGHIVRGDADICGTVLLMRRNRAEVLSFLTQPVRTTMRFVFREPPLSLQNNLFYLPFRSTVWISVGALIIFLIFVIYLSAKWEMEKNGTKRDDPTVLRPDVGDVAMFVAGAVVQQSSNTELKGSLGRVVTFIMFLIFLFLYTSYSANIVALLQSSSNQIRSLADLLDSKLELGVEDQPYTRYYFTTASDRVRKAIYEVKVARAGYKPNFMPIEEGVKKLRNMDVPFAFHMNLGMGYKFVEQLFYEHQKCGLSEIEYIPNAHPWVSCRKTSPYKEIYKIGLSRILEHGISDRVNRLIYARKPACTSRGGSFGSVNMMDFHPVLLCLLYGMVAAVILLGMEILVHKRHTRMNMVVMKSAETYEDLKGCGDNIEDIED